MTDYPAGTRLRVTFVGTVDSHGELVCGMLGFVPSELARAELARAELARAERVEVIEPEWQSGDVVLDANGAVWGRRGDGAWLLPGRKDDWHSPVRPLTLLARGGKPATA